MCVSGSVLSESSLHCSECGHWFWDTNSLLFVHLSLWPLEDLFTVLEDYRNTLLLYYSVSSSILDEEDDTIPKRPQ